MIIAATSKDGLYIHDSEKSKTDVLVMGYYIFLETVKFDFEGTIYTSVTKEQYEELDQTFGIKK